jgi:hypothetical protein
MPFSNTNKCVMLPNTSVEWTRNLLRTEDTTVSYLTPDKLLLFWQDCYSFPHSLQESVKTLHYIRIYR